MALLYFTDAEDGNRTVDVSPAAKTDHLNQSWRLFSPSFLLKHEIWDSQVPSWQIFLALFCSLLATCAAEHSCGFSIKFTQTARRKLWSSMVWNVPLCFITQSGSSLVLPQEDQLWFINHLTRYRCAESSLTRQTSSYLPCLGLSRGFDRQKYELAWCKQICFRDSWDRVWTWKWTT